MKSSYTPRQGQFLAFIHHYTVLHGRAPAEADMVQFFKVTPPSVHQMILTLERRGFICRTPGEARSVRIILPPENLPQLQGAAETAKIPPLAHHIESPSPADAQVVLTNLGRIQIEDLFAHNLQHPLDDSEFLPLLDTLIKSFARAGLGVAQVKELRRRVCEVYHQCCQEAEPESTFEENMELMFSYLPGPAQTNWQRWI
ncbi:MAG TPA: hypothetical protein VMF08_01455 [Candidatus Sulfotelmatobacter sp.]|nr:hypothetical protein [Candidatus Sulfotelmatobacter sp.]